ncbi:MAG: DUF4118 domain-containing protein [Faecalibacterium sp.]|nr:DUF4118 domain-containing protein [Faecalibacterium sp.]
MPNHTLAPGRFSLPALLRQLALAFSLAAFATVIGFLFLRAGFPETNIVLIYLFMVVACSYFANGKLAGVSCSVLGTLAFNYFFTEPIYSLKVYDPSYLITFFIMTVVAVITTALTVSMKNSAQAAREKEQEATALYQLANRLSDASSMSSIAEIAASSVSGSFFCRVGCLCFGEGGAPEASFCQQAADGRMVRRKIGPAEDLVASLKNLRTASAVNGEFWDYPIYGGSVLLAALRIPAEEAQRFTQNQTQLLHTMLENIALAMDRCRATMQQLRSHEEAEQERYRANLLRAISHDLRTPLTGIIGTAEMLESMLKGRPEEYALSQDIYQDATWLHSMMENILSLTRLQDGHLALKKQPEAVEEIIGGALAQMEKRAPDYDIQVHIPEELLLVPMDARLIEQVLLNLLDNAAKHTPPHGEIVLSVQTGSDKKLAVFTVEDSGSGIPPDDLPVIFQPFYTSRGNLPDARRGNGLGLAICDAVVKAHGGTISAANRADRTGACFTFTLPMEETSRGKQ